MSDKIPPAPWKAERSGVYDANGKAVMAAWCGDPIRAENRETAQMISATPDLHEVVETVNALLGLTIERTYPDLKKMIDAALAKANGEGKPL